MAHLVIPATRHFLDVLPRPLREHLLHLLECADCRDAVRRAPAPEEASYETVFERAERFLGEHLAASEEERREAAAAVEALLATAPGSWPSFVSEHAEAASPHFIALLLEHASRRGTADPAGSEQLAQVSRIAIERLGEAVPAGLRIDLLVRSWCVTGQSRSRRAQWQAADSAFARASRMLAESSQPETEAALCRTLAESFQARRRLPEAAALFARAAQLSEELGLSDATAGDLGALARLLGERGDLWRAVDLIAAASVEPALCRPEAVRSRLARTRVEGRDPAVDEAFLATCRSAVRYAEALFARELDAGLRTDDAVMAANAAVNLGMIYQHEHREHELAGLAPAFGTIAASTHLGSESRAAFGRVAEALGSGTDPAGLLRDAAEALVRDADDQLQPCELHGVPLYER